MVLFFVNYSCHNFVIVIFQECHSFVGAKNLVIPLIHYIFASRNHKIFRGKMKEQKSDKTTQHDESEEKFRTREKMLEKLIEHIYQGEKGQN